MKFDDKLDLRLERFCLRERESHLMKFNLFSLVSSKQWNEQIQVVIGLYAKNIENQPPRRNSLADLVQIEVGGHFSASLG